MATRGLEQIHGAIGIKETQKVFFKVDELES